MQQFLEIARAMPATSMPLTEPRTTDLVPALATSVVTSAKSSSVAGSVGLPSIASSATLLSSASEGTAGTPAPRSASVIECAQLSSKLAAVSAAALTTSVAPIKPLSSAVLSTALPTVPLSAQSTSQSIATVPTVGSTNSATAVSIPVAAAVTTDEKDAHFSKMSHYLQELKRELDAVQKQRKDKHLETQRLREKCQQLEEKLQSSARTTQRLEEQQASHQGVVGALQGQVVNLMDTVSRLNAELAHLRLRSPFVVSPTEGLGIQPQALGPAYGAQGSSAPVEIGSFVSGCVPPPAAVSTCLPTHRYPSNGSIHRSDSNKTGTSSLPDATSNSNLQDYFMGTPPVSPPQPSHKGIPFAAHTVAHAQQVQHGPQHNHSSSSQLTQGFPVPVPHSMVINTTGSQSVAGSLSATSGQPAPATPIVSHHAGSIPHSYGGNNSQTDLAADGLAGPGHPLVRTKSLSQAQQGTPPGVPLTAQQAAVLQMQQMVDNAVNNININTSTVASASSKQAKIPGADASTTAAKYTASGYSSGTATPTYRPNNANPAVTGPPMQAVFLLPQQSHTAPPLQGAPQSQSHPGMYHSNKHGHGAGQSQVVSSHCSSHPYNPLQMQAGGPSMQGNAFQPMQQSVPIVSYQFAPPPHSYSLEARLYNSNLPTSSSNSGSPAYQVSSQGFHSNAPPHTTSASAQDMFNSTTAGIDNANRAPSASGNQGVHNSTAHDELDTIAARPSNNMSDFLSIDASIGHPKPS